MQGAGHTAAFIVLPPTRKRARAPPIATPRVTADPLRPERLLTGKVGLCLECDVV